jgi:hypothetical protein
MNKYLSGGDVKKVKSIAKAEVKGHEGRMHGQKYAKGGVTSLQRKELGRGMAKVANQKKSSFTYRKSGSK